MHISEFITRFDKVKKGGKGYQVCCPSHLDKEQSLSISEGEKGGIVLKCFAGCETRDILAAVGCTFADVQPAKVEQAPAARRDKVIDKVYEYHNEDGYPVFQVVRYKPKGFRQRTMKDGQMVYSTEGIVKPLYRLPKVLEAIKDGAPVFYCEGEKDVETLEALGLAATTHCGGASAWGSAEQYISVLSKVKHLYILPDNDQPGRNLAITIRRDLPHAEIIYLPGLPDKGDVTDWMKNGGSVEILLDLASKASGQEKKPEPETRHYRCLGYNGNYYYFLPSDTKQVKHLTAHELSQRANLYTLAPRDYWETSSEFIDCTGTRGALDYGAIAEMLMRQCTKAGIYTDEIRRGMGAWMDDGRTVLHMGNSLSVDGETLGLLDIETRYVYEARAGRVTVGNEAIPDDKALEFIDLCLMPYWEDEIYGKLLAGWMACAPICGTLKWRPHIWINGPAGCGKSYISTNIVGRVLSGVLRQFASSTTEAGIRQKLASDALPVLFDEAEGDTKGSRDNIMRILELMRHSSSDSEALITKGSSGGISTDFAIRSMFCMSSIAHGISRKADDSRISVLRMGDSTRRIGAREAFGQLADTLYGLLTQDFASGFVARSCGNAKLIRHNAETFATVLSDTQGGRRYGDQVGTMLAGYCSLTRMGYLDAESARGIVDGLNLDALASPDMDRGKDEEQCLKHLIEHPVRVDGPHMDKAYTDTVGNLIYKAIRMADHTSADTYTLDRIGIRVEQDGVLVSNTHKGLATIYNNSPYCGQWATYLKRLDGVRVNPQPVRFGGSPSRCVSLPLSCFI